MNKVNPVGKKILSASGRTKGTLPSSQLSSMDFSFHNILPI